VSSLRARTVPGGAIGGKGGGVAAVGGSGLDD
jgi:hypothetical protein